MAILNPLKRLSEWFLIIAMLYLSIDGMCVLTTIISGFGGKERECVEGLMSILVTISLTVSLILKFVFRMPKSLLEYLLLYFSLFTLLGLSFLGNEGRTTLIIVIYLVLNGVLFLVQKIIFHKKQKKHKLSNQLG
ncbi:hypothetical protein [Lysinibacillus sp. FSL K6-0102]|uniref:hypothetical protein n=1 Tax=Lysinibacillus sp. FSL K6-0102 TaxID=2975290 RepID=UPI0030F6E265